MITFLPNDTITQHLCGVLGKHLKENNSMKTKNQLSSTTFVVPSLNNTFYNIIYCNYGNRIINICKKEFEHYGERVRL